MTDEHDYDLADDNAAENSASGVRRFVPMLVVAMAMSGFGGLAWYAYHAGSNAVSEEDLLLIEADKSPLKETPSDPGGMKFPHQDKTVFEAFSSQSGGEAQVERVIPAPEEPMEKPVASTGETKTWVNEKLRGKSETVEPEEMDKAIAAQTAATAPAQEETAEKAAAKAGATPLEADRSAKQDRGLKPAVVASELAGVAPSADAKAAVEISTSQPADVLSSAAVVAAAVATKTEAKPAERKSKERPIVEKTEKPAAKANAAARVQLGAYKSEAEARSEWAKIARRNANALSGKTPMVVRADLGEKGVFYRLQVHGLNGSAEAKELCTMLQAKGQACILPAGK